MKTLLSLFDYSGAWSQPFWDAGWNVIEVDIKHGTDIRDFCCEYIIENYLDGIDTVDGILIAVPCTEFAVSGARHWKAKDRDGRTKAAVHLVRQSLATVDFLMPDFWALENPIGRIAKLCPGVGPPQLYFDPCDYAGWLGLSRAAMARLDRLSRQDPQTFTGADVAHVRACNAYTKKTVLYGAFNRLEKRRIEPVRCCTQGSWLQRLGGRSEATKAARSMTPAGFSKAFYEANKDRTVDWEAIDEGRAEYQIHPEVSQTSVIRGPNTPKLSQTSPRAKSTL